MEEIQIPSACPLCDVSGSIERPQRLPSRRGRTLLDVHFVKSHVAKHLEQLALLACELPVAGDQQQQSVEALVPFLPSASTADSKASAPFPTLDHWAKSILDTTHDRTSIETASNDDVDSCCFGIADASALLKLSQDGFQSCFEKIFDAGTLRARLYHRASDNRARILVTQLKSGSELRDNQFCLPLVTLKMIRSGPVLLLCRAKRDGTYTAWTRLKFRFYEGKIGLWRTLVMLTGPKMWYYSTASSKP